MPPGIDPHFEPGQPVKPSFQVSMFPDYRKNNPYQAELEKYLEERSIGVVFPYGYKRGFHFTRTFSQSEYKRVKILHLHWPDMYLRGEGTLRRWVYAWKLLVDLRLACRNGRELAWTLHNLGSHDGGAEDPVERFFYHRLARQAGILFVHDKSLVEPVVSRFSVPPGKIQVIPHGHYADVYGPSPDRQTCREKLGIPPHRKVVLFFGMLRPYKGLDLLLDTWAKVHEAVPSSLLLIAGGGRDHQFRDHIEKRATHTDAVTLHNRFIPDDEIPNYFGAADLAVYPFRQITTSGSLILALSYSCPVVAPKLESITGEIGFMEHLLYDPSGDCAKGLGRALINGLTERGVIQHAFFDKVRDHYSWEKAARLTEDGYRTALAEKA